MRSKAHKPMVASSARSATLGPYAFHHGRTGRGSPDLRPPQASSRMGGRVAVAHLTSQRPKVSHRSSRREMVALEHEGHPVVHVALRGWDAETVDSAGRDEQAATQFLLQGGARPLVWRLLGSGWSSPSRLWGAFKLGRQLGSCMARCSFWVHWISLAEPYVAARSLQRGGASQVLAQSGITSAEVAGW